MTSKPSVDASLQTALVTSVPPLATAASAPDGGRTPSLISKMLHSFEKNGFSVVSVNRPSEIDLLRTLFPDICFVIDDTTRAIFPERYGPSIESIMAACAEYDFSAIVNADVYMLGSNIVEVLDRNPGTFFVARRLDVDRIGGDIVGLYRRGIDAMFFSSRRFAAVAKDPNLGRFQLGAPFWDIIVPIVASFHGTVSFIDPPFILHPVHNARWSHVDYDKLREAAIKTVIRHAELHSDRSDRARAFLQLIDQHVRIRGDVLTRRSIRNAMMIFDLWLGKIERENPRTIHVEIDDALSQHSLEKLSDRLIDAPSVENPQTRARGLRRLNRLVKAVLREWKRKRREKAISHALVDIDF